MSRSHSVSPTQVSRFFRSTVRLCGARFKGRSARRAKPMSLEMRSSSRMCALPFTAFTRVHCDNERRRPEFHPRAENGLAPTLATTASRGRSPGALETSGTARSSTACRHPSERPLGNPVGEKCPGMAGDLLVFLRGQNERRAARLGIADRILYRPISSFVEARSRTIRRRSQRALLHRFRSSFRWAPPKVSKRRRGTSIFTWSR
jgi:hypothetical protein